MTNIPCPQCVQPLNNGHIVSVDKCVVCKGRGHIRDPKTHVCNGCGGSVYLRGDDVYPAGLIGASVSGGYFSRHLSDGVTYTFDMCEKCLRDMFEGFEIPPATFSCIDSEVTYARDRDWYSYVLWRDGGGERRKLSDGLCNNNESCPNEAKYRIFAHGALLVDCVCEEHLKTYDSRYEYVEANLVAAIPLKADERSQDERMFLANVWLSSHKTRKSWTYIGECIQDALGLPEETSATWVPTHPGSVVGNEAHYYPHYADFADGRLYYGPTKR